MAEAVTRAASSAGDTPRVQRIERKFYIEPQRVPLALGLLRHSCRPAVEFHEERISSLYFDSPDLAEHVRSMAGEFDKNKIRIRWYGTLQELAGDVSAFLELKSRQGFASSKRRRSITVLADRLAPGELRSGIVPPAKLTQVLAEFGFFRDTPLVPVINISYWRYRFTELTTGYSVALDCDIHSTMVMRHLGSGERELHLAGGVVEVKGPRMELPVPLRSLRKLGVDWTRFSKYSSCIEAHLLEPGALGRLWPSGRMID